MEADLIHLQDTRIRELTQPKLVFGGIEQRQ